jgi:hypothetical protein
MTYVTYDCSKKQVLESRLNRTAIASMTYHHCINVRELTCIIVLSYFEEYMRIYISISRSRFQLQHTNSIAMQQQAISHQSSSDHLIQIIRRQDAQAAQRVAWECSTTTKNKQDGMIISKPPTATTVGLPVF